MAGRTGLPQTDRGWQSYLTNLGSPPKREWLAMGAGLTVCLEPSGAKTFQIRVRRQGEANPRRINIGSFPAISVAGARKKALEAKSQAKEGKDPALEQRRARLGANEPRTLRDLIREYLSRRETLVAAKTLKIENDLLVGVLEPALGDRLLTDLGPVDFGRVVSDYAARLRREGRSAGTNANKLLAATRRMFSQARGWGLITRVDPTDGLKKPAKEEARERVLPDGKLLQGADPGVNELGALVGALRSDISSITESTKAALLLTILMGFRALEVTSLEWESVRLDAPLPTVTVTTSKTKAGLRSLPLPECAVTLLTAMRPQSSRLPKYVFPAEKRAKRTPHLHPESLSRAFSRLCDRLGVPGATLHDLRRTCLTGLIELGHSGIAERVAGHAPRSVLGRHYDRSTRLNEMHRALSEWADVVEAAGVRAGEALNV